MPCTGVNATDEARPDTLFDDEEYRNCFARVALDILAVNVSFFHACLNHETTYLYFVNQQQRHGFDPN